MYLFDFYGMHRYRVKSDLGMKADVKPNISLFFTVYNSRRKSKLNFLSFFSLKAISRIDFQTNATDVV